MPLHMTIVHPHLRLWKIGSSWIPLGNLKQLMVSLWRLYLFHYHLYLKHLKL
jgi:hypothetical protein